MAAKLHNKFVKPLTYLFRFNFFFTVNVKIIGTMNDILFNYDIFGYLCYY